MDASVSVGIFPPGMLFPYAGSTAPGFGLVCDGSAVSRTTYARLFAVIGTTYGAGDGSTTFNLPNAAGRALVGAGTYTDSVSGSVTRTLGQSLGAEKHVLTTPEMPSHTHTQDAHTHTSPGYTDSGGSTDALARTTVGNGSLNYTSNSTTATNQNTGGGGSHNNMQPSLVINYIITH